MQKKRITLRHRVEYMLFMTFVMVVKVSPLFLLNFNKRVVGFLARHIGKRHMGIVEKNLGIAFPRYTEEKKSKLIDDIYHHFSSIFVEIIYLFIKKTPEKILKKIELNNIETLERALEKKKGVILFTAHFGNWELIPFILKKKINTKILAVARESDNPLVEKLVKQSREQMGATIIYKKNSIRRMLKMLEKNCIVCVLIDQNTVEKEAVFVDFFGHKVSAVPSVSLLHLKKDKPVIPLFVHYEKDKIVLDLLEEIHFAGTGNLENDIQQLTQHCTTLIEENIKKHPEQWFWFHNRWKTRPPEKRR